MYILRHTTGHLINESVSLRSSNIGLMTFRMNAGIPFLRLYLSLYPFYNHTNCPLHFDRDHVWDSYLSTQHHFHEWRLSYCCAIITSSALLFGCVKEAPYSYAYFWIFRQYICINTYVIFFSTWHENIVSVEYIEVIFDTVSIIIAT